MVDATELETYFACPSWPQSLNVHSRPYSTAPNGVCGNNCYNSTDLRINMRTSVKAGRQSSLELALAGVGALLEVECQGESEVPQIFGFASAHSIRRGRPLLRTVHVTERHYSTLLFWGLCCQGQRLFVAEL